MHPLQSEFRQRQGAQERRHPGHGMDRAADIVIKSRQGQLRSAHPAAGGFAGFENEHPQPFPGEGDPGGQPVGTGTHNHGVKSIVRHGRNSIKKEPCPGAGLPVQMDEWNFSRKVVRPCFPIPYRFSTLP